MPTIIALFMVSAQLVAAVAGYFYADTPLFDTVIYYGSPPAIMLSILSNESTLLIGNFYFALIIIFHVTKYIFLIVSQAQHALIGAHYTAVLLEAVYLVAAFYYLFNTPH